MTMENSKQSIILSEISSLREEMSQLSELVRRNVTNSEINIPSQVNKTCLESDTKSVRSKKNPHFVFEIQSEGLNDRTLTYLSDIFNVQIHPILQGINHNLSKAFNELGESFSDLEHEKLRIRSDIHNALNEMRHHKNIIKFRIKPTNGKIRDITQSTVSSIPDGDISDFTTKIPEIMKALAHENKIKLLRTLRNSDYSQGELAEITGIQGGTFKNHMDSLLDTNFVQQSEVRGNYFITTLGVEALSYAEMLYKRSKSYTKYESNDITAKEDNL